MSKWGGPWVNTHLLGGKKNPEDEGYACGCRTSLSELFKLAEDPPKGIELIFRGHGTDRFRADLCLASPGEGMREEDYEKLSRHPNLFVKCLLCSAPFLPWSVLRTLSQDSSPGVKLELASFPRERPPELFLTLAKDESKEVREAVRFNRFATDEALMMARAFDLVRV